MPTLAEALFAQPMDRLRDLIVVRRLDPRRLASAPDKRVLCHLLTAELTRPQSLNTAALMCNARQLRLLQVIVSQETSAGLTWKRVVEAVGSELEPALERVMDGLTRLGLAFRLGPNVYVPDGVRHHVPRSLSDGYTLERLLSFHDAPALKKIAENLGLRAGTRAANVADISATLLDRDSLRRLNPPLTAEERSVLAYILSAGGDALPTEVAAEVFGGKTDEFFRYDWQNRWKQGRSRNAVDTLLGRGMLFVLSASYGYNLILVMPGDLIRALTDSGGSGFWTDPAPVPVPLASQPASHTEHTGLIRDIVSLLGFVGTQEATRTNTGYIHKTSLKNAARNFTLVDDRYASFVYAMCRSAELMAPYGEKGAYALTEAGERWLHLTQREQQRSLFNAWFSGPTWGEMFQEPLQKVRNYRAPTLMSAIRQAALNVVRESAAPEFLDIVSLADAMAFGSPLMLTETTQHGQMVASPLVFNRLLIGECLFWLGMVELCGAEADPIAKAAAAKGARAPSTRTAPMEKSGLPEFTGFRLTPLGAHLLGAKGPQLQDAPREDKFIVQANAEIFVPPYLAPALFYNLLTLTDTPAKGATGNTVHLTRDSIRRLLDRGATAQDIIGFLREHARTGIPQNVEYLILEVGGKHGHIHVGRAHTYITTDSPILMKELQARRELKGKLLRTLSDVVAVVDAEDPEQLLRDLRKAGYFPVNDDAALRNPLHVERPAAAPTASASSRAVEKAAPAELDWNRLARDDGKPWSAHAEMGTVMPPDAAQGKVAIARLMAQAIEEERLVQFAQAGTAEPEVIIPVHLYGNLLQGTSNGNTYTTVKLSSVTWARLL